MSSNPYRQQSSKEKANLKEASMNIEYKMERIPRKGKAKADCMGIQLPMEQQSCGVSRKIVMFPQKTSCGAASVAHPALPQNLSSPIAAGPFPKLFTFACKMLGEGLLRNTDSPGPEYFLQILASQNFPLGRPWLTSLSCAAPQTNRFFIPQAQGCQQTISAYVPRHSPQQDPLAQEK
jgi:hypothetical protein